MIFFILIVQVLQHADKQFLVGKAFPATVLSVEEDGGLVHLTLTGKLSVSQFIPVCLSLCLSILVSFVSDYAWKLASDPIAYTIHLR